MFNLTLEGLAMLSTTEPLKGFLPANDTDNAPSVEQKEAAIFVESGVQAHKSH